MKLNTLINLFLAGLVLIFSAAGCKTKTPPITKLPEGSKPGAETGPGPGAPVSGTGQQGVSSATSTGGIPQGPGHPGWTEEPGILQADTVYFDYDSSVIKPSEKSKIGAVADYLKGNAANAVKIEGHCDERGTEEYNRALGERRALAVREELVGLGIDATRVDTISYGKDRPAETGHDESAWKKNRRGVFVVLTPPK
jgi:peptidoglycan-associated lipoprotein